MTETRPPVFTKTAKSIISAEEDFFVRDFFGREELSSGDYEERKCDQFSFERKGMVACFCELFISRRVTCPGTTRYVQHAGDEQVKAETQVKGEEKGSPKET